jgi:putative hydrolase of the HAD superfamily
MIRIHHDWQEIAALVGIELPCDFGADRLADHGLLSDYQNGAMGDQEFLDRLAAEFGVDRELAREAHARILREEYDGALALVKELKALEVGVYCLSNTNALHYAEFFEGRFPVCAAFDELFASHRLGLSKPDPAIYEWLENRLGLGGAEIAFFDDAARNIESAQKRGWQAFVVDPAGDPPGVIRQELQSLGLFDRH